MLEVKSEFSKYALRQVSRSLDFLLSFPSLSVINLNAFLMQYLVIYSLVFLSFLNLESNMEKTLKI